MEFGKIEPHEQEKLKKGYEYVKLVPGDSQTTVIYFDRESQREEIHEGSATPVMIELVNSGWQNTHSGPDGQYFVREKPQAEQPSAEEAQQAARKPPEELKQIVGPFDTHKMKPNVDYVYVVWFRDTGRTTLTYFNTDGSRTENRDVNVYGDIENELIQQGYYVVDSGGGREGVSGHYAKYRDS